MDQQTKIKLEKSLWFGLYFVDGNICFEIKHDINKNFDISGNECEVNCVAIN